MDKFNSDDNESLDYNTYLGERKSLIETAQKQSILLDQSILYIATGTFGVSLTFINQIAPSPKNGTLILLGIAWISLFISIISTIISFYTSQKACIKQIEIIENMIQNNNNLDEANDLKNSESKWTEKLNMISIISFIFGILLLGLFTYINLL